MSDRSRATPLASLTAAALALPAFSAAAAPREEHATVALRASQYQEAEFEGATGSSDRYDIAVFQLRAGAPVFDSWRVSADLAYETMSGASPWFVQPGAAGEPVQVMSGASPIKDARTDAALAWRFHAPDAELGFTAGFSTEDDYESVNGGWESLVGFRDGHTTLNFGAGFSHDRLEPTDSVQNARDPAGVGAEKRTTNVVAGVSQILSRTAVVQLALSGTRSEGYLSDPYKLAFVEAADPQLVRDARPAEREQLAATLRLRWRLPVAASLHADYRFFRDDWKIEAHTVDLAWYQELGDWWVVPSLRWYSQSQAYFYRPFYRQLRADGFYASDYRLSPYGAVTYGLRVVRRIGEHAVTIALEHYDSDADYALREVDVENPGLVDFTLGTLGVDFKI